MKETTGMLVFLVILMWSAAALAIGSKSVRVELPMMPSQLWGLSLVRIQTSKGMAVFILDSGSNVTTFDEPGPIVLHLGQEKIELKASRNHPQIHEATEQAPEIRGILGQDVLRRYARVTLDFRTNQVVLER